MSLALRTTLIPTLADAFEAYVDDHGRPPTCLVAAGHFVADYLEKATVDAIQREAFLAMDSLARRYGTPRALPQESVNRIRAEERSAADWWWFYAAEVGAPRRSAAGL